MVTSVNTFQQSTGLFSPPMGWPVNGYAGHGDGKNNPAMQNVKGVGPLPRGIYRAVELFEQHPHLGPYALRLEPDEETRALIVSLGRDPDSFYCHGDSISHPGEASDGCIILPIVQRRFVWMNAPFIHVVE